MLQSYLKYLQIEQVNRTASGLRKQIPTFIFGQDAKNFTMQQVFEISSAAFGELCLLHPNLRKFYHALFSPEAVRYDRDVHSPHDNQDLDKHILAYLSRAVQFFAYPACIKSMEFLVRRFRIDIYLKYELVMLFMPYHEMQSYRYILDCVSFEGLDATAFPCSRDQLTYFWLMRNQHYLAYLISTTLMLKGQSFDVYVKFALTTLIELVGKVQNPAEFNRKCLDFVNQLLATQLSYSTAGYAGSLVLMLSQEKLQSNFANELVFRVSKQEELLAKHKLLIFYRIRKFSEFDINCDIGDIYLGFLSESYPELLRPLEYEQLAEWILSAVLVPKNAHLEATCYVIDAMLARLEAKTLRYPSFVAFCTKHFLHLQIKHSEDILRRAQALDIHSFNFGISLHIQSGGAYTDIYQFSIDNSLMPLQYGVDGYQITIIAALSNPNYHIRYYALEAVERIVADPQNSAHTTSIYKYLILNLQDETDLTVLSKYFSIISHFVGQPEYNNVMTDGQVVNSVYRTLRRLLYLKFSGQLNEIIINMRGLLPDIAEQYARTRAYLELYDSFINNYDLDSTLKVFEGNSAFDIIFPFETTEQFLDCVTQNFADTNVLAVVYLMNIGSFELTPIIVEQLLRSPKLRDILLNRLYVIYQVAQIKQIIQFLKGDLLLEYFISVYKTSGIERLLEIIDQTFSSKQMQIYDEFVAFFVQNIKYMELPYAIYFVNMLVGKYYSPQAGTIFYALPTSVRCLVGDDLLEIGVELSAIYLLICAAASSFVAQAFFELVFHKLGLAYAPEQAGSLLVELFQFAIAESTPCTVKGCAVYHFYAYLLKNRFCGETGIGETAYYTVCALSDQLMQQKADAAFARHYLLLSLAVLNALDLTEFQEIPLALWILFDIRLFDESIQANPALQELSADQLLLAAVREYFMRVPLSLRFCETITQSHRYCLVEALQDHDGPIDEPQHIFDFILHAIEDADSVTQNQCIKLLIKYYNYDRVTVSAEQARAVFMAIQNVGMVEDPINKLLTFAPYFDLATLKDFLRYAITFMQFTPEYLRMLVGLIFEKFQHYDLIEIIIILVRTILTCKQRSVAEQMRLLHALYSNVPETISLALITIIELNNDVFSYLQELARLFDTNSVFGSLSVLLGYVFDVPLIVDILLEDGGAYVAKLLLDDVLPDSDNFVAYLLDAVEVVLRYVGEVNDVSECSESMQVSPFEFLLTIVFVIYEHLDALERQLWRFISAPAIIVRVLRDMDWKSLSELSCEKAFKALSASIANCNSVDALYDTFYELCGLIEQKFERQYALRFYVYLLEKSPGSENNTHMMEMCDKFVTLAVEHFSALETSELDLCVYALSFCPAVLQTRLIQHSQAILGLLSHAARTSELRDAALDCLEQMIYYTIKYTTFLLESYFKILALYPPGNITQSALVHGEIEFEEGQDYEKYQAQQETLEQVLRILQVIQLNVPPRIIYPFVLRCLKTYAFSQDVACISRYNYLIVHLMRLTAQSYSNVQQLQGLFASYIQCVHNAPFYNLLISAFCVAFSQFTIAFTNQDMQNFLSECLNTSYADAGSVPLFSKAQGTVKSNYYNLAAVFLLFASIATVKQTQFYSFIIEHLPDILSSVENANCTKPQSLGKEVDSAAAADLSFKTPFYVVLLEFRLPAELLAYFYFRFFAEFFHSAPFAVEAFLVSKIHRVAIFLLENVANDHVELAAVDFYNKLSLLQHSYLNFEQIGVDIATDLIGAGRLPQLIAFIRNCTGDQQIARTIADQVVELRESGKQRELVSELVAVIEAATRKSFKEFL